ncbi:MAG: DUF4914 family protein [Oscillospiraceae bacterium]|nr:DUF4914 family protein [Oscillospiraceae bacterium]
MKKELKKLNLPAYLNEILENCKDLILPRTKSALYELSFGRAGNDLFEVRYALEDGKDVCEAVVTRCKNGMVVNYPEDYMRRRDPDCLLVADNFDTDKPRYRDRYHADFGAMRSATFDWLKAQDLLALPFKAGGSDGYNALLIAPRNAAFFAFALANMQEPLDIETLPDDYSPKGIIFLAPPFRHTVLGGRQVVVHNRLPEIHEIFAYNLYPGPSAKKGIYGMLLNIGEREGWVTAHASVVKVITPYDNEIVIMHEGASGSGKSEMLEDIHRELDGRIVLSQNIVTSEQTYIRIDESCELRPVTDDMAMCHPKLQNGSRKLVIKDAESGWFLRVDNIKNYGTAPQFEKIFTQPSEPLIFINLQGVAKATCLVWEHTPDSDGVPCPNPRVVLPRHMVPKIINEPIEVDVRSFGVRTPPCTKANPSYGIIGMFQILPPALAWLWRLAAPRGYKNPSITASTGLASEGVGTYWPFATGKKTRQANLLLEQIARSTSTRYLLIPNQHIGAYEVGFMPQWIAREYISRRGSARMKPDQLIETRCPLLGYALNSLKIDGQYIRKEFLQPELQKEVGPEVYDQGAETLTAFFRKEILKYSIGELDPLGREIVQAFMDNASLQNYTNLLPMKF